MRRVVPLYWLAVAATSSGCNCPGEQKIPAPAVSSSASAAPVQDAGPSRAAHTDDNVHPVYPATNAPADPLAQKYCEAIHALPAARKAACCNRPPGTTVTGECARMLSFALREKAVTLDAAAVDRCKNAMEEAHAGCGWIGPIPPAIPAECDGAIRGALPEGKPCRSSLECLDGLRCRGAGPTDLGVCAPPAGRGRACALAVDTLAIHTRQDSFDVRHPECAGFCAHRRCEDTVAAGKPCKGHLECGAGRACVDRRCSDTPLPGAGKPCQAGLCAPGARCVKGQCIAPKPEGEACELDLECAGACHRPDGGGAGHCGKRCGLL